MDSCALSHHLFLLFLLPLLLLYPSTFAQTNGNITLGSSLSTLNQTDVLLSPAGEFAFGFHPIEANGGRFLLAIWFNKILTERTVVWYANGDSPVGSGSKVELTTDGRLVLSDQNGNEVWKANPSNTGNVSYATMLDSGNLVLASADGTTAWQSFDEPADTMLPTQVMNRGGVLSSHQSETDFSVGRFQMRLLPDGNLVLNTIALPTDHAYERYWITNDTFLLGFQVVFNQSSGIHVVRSDGILENVTQLNVDSGRNYYQRATLDPDGVFRYYIYPRRNETNGNWSVTSFIPDDICSAVLVEKGGSGACGFNSYCKPNGGSSSCECPVGYSYSDPSDSRKGCRPDFLGWSCELDGTQAEAQFDMNELPNVDWPSAGDIEQLLPMGEDICQSNCLRDCLCVAARYKEGTCWKKKFPLSNGRMDSNLGGKMLIKVPKANSSSQIPFPPDFASKKKDRSALVLVESVLLGTSVFINFLLLSVISVVVLFFCNKRLQRDQLESRMAGINLRSFTYKEIEEATDRFKEELGQGSFGRVYKGVLTMEPGTFVAVKKLDKVVKEGEKEFKAEMSTIGRTHHKNLVQLLGFCNEGPHRILIYEFMSRGSLANFLFGSIRPEWNQRLRIAFGIARGLMYLHEECSTQIIHCDIKPHNVLLDDRLCPKISDFGLAKLLMTDQSRTNTGIRGTKGYVAPEWFKELPITAKVDVYSFGVLLLEIICCRKNVEPKVEDEELMVLTDWANDCYRVGRLDALVANDEEAKLDERRLERLVSVAIWCIQEEPSLRPNMKKVTQMLEGAVEVPIPPDPTSFISSID